MRGLVFRLLTEFIAQDYTEFVDSSSDYREDSMSYMPKHFYVVFNPLLGERNPDYLTSAHEVYFKLKEQWKSDFKEPHMYWAKVKKTQRPDSLNELDFIKVIEENKKNFCSTHLYISDFNHLWVAKIDSVCKKISNHDYTLEAYKKEDVELWFKITEMDLISSDPRETIGYISFLKTEAINSLNPYLSGLRYPLIVSDSYDEKYFAHIDDSKSIMLKENPLISNSADRIKELVLSYAIPEANFLHLPLVARNEILNIELEFLDLNKHGGAKTGKMRKVATSYIQLLECVLNHTMIENFRTTNEVANLKEEIGKKHVDNSLFKLCGEKNLSLYEIERIIVAESYGGLFNIYSRLNKEKKGKFSNYLKNVLSKVLNKKIVSNYSLRDIRNDQAHLEGEIEMTYFESLEIRNLILGVGCKGVINEIIENWYEDKVEIKNLKMAA